jgi:dephospho-CoA kinase
LKIGITGGIGSGKSTVTDYITEQGYQVFDADKIAHEIVMPDGRAIGRLVSAFGEDIVMKDGNLDRKALAAIVFSDKEKRKVLNDITHAEIRDIIMEGLENPQSDPVFADVPLLFETGFYKEVDRVWLVTAPEETRIRRVSERDGASSAEVKARIDSQMPESEKRALADRIINNDGSLAELYAQIDRLLEEING